MPLNYAIFPQSGLGNGPNHSLPAPVLRLDGGQRLAHNTLSDSITGPCEIYVFSDEECWLSIDETGTEPNPGNSPLKIPADVPLMFSILKGSWNIKSLVVA
jgi:hypothetical protein